MPPKGIRRIQRRNVAHVMALGREILQRESVPGLDDRELRKFTRSFLRSVRYGYHTTLGQLLRSNYWAKEQLANYLIPRVRKHLRSIELSKEAM